MHTNQQLKELLLNHIRGTLSEKDRETLFVSLADEQFADQWKLLISELSSEMRITGSYNEAEWEPVIQEIWRKEENVDSSTQHSAPVRYLANKKWWWAAAAIFIIAVSITIIVSSDQKFNTLPATEVAHIPTNDIKAPENTKAFITLADGRIVFLDSTKNGELAQQGNVKLVKLANGQIAYKTEDGQVLNEITYNTLSNPRGSKIIDMTLADGSRVWLNAGSSVTYPVVFVGKERKVNISGEAYFEISHDASKPFKVTNGDLEVAVLGTHFNINSYDDEEQIKVTLLEGSVKVTTTKQLNNSTILKPGQQAQVARTIKVLNDVDTDEVMAWKNGKFIFGDKADIHTIMRQISRWYNVEVEYRGTVNSHFWGSISRNVNISSVLQMLEATDAVNFKVEGNKVIVMP